MSNTKGTEEVNEQGAVEIKVETVDYRLPAGHDDEPPKKEKVEIIHRTDKEDNPGVLADAAAAVKDKMQSAKDAISSSGKNGK